MTTDLQPSTRTATMPRRSWTLVLAAEVLALVQAVFMLIYGGVNGNIVEYLGYGDAAVPSDNPPLFTTLLYLTRMMGLWGVALITFAMTITIGPYRRGERWAWRTLWIFPVAYLAALPLEKLAFGIAWPEVGGLGITVLYFAVPATFGLALGARHTHR